MTSWAENAKCKVFHRLEGPPGRHHHHHHHHHHHQHHHHHHLLTLRVTRKLAKSCWQTQRLWWLFKLFSNHISTIPWSQRANARTRIWLKHELATPYHTFVTFTWGSIRIFFKKKVYIDTYIYIYSSCLGKGFFVFLKGFTER